MKGQGQKKGLKVKRANQKGGQKHPKREADKSVDLISGTLKPQKHHP